MEGLLTQKTVTFIHLFVIGPALSAIGRNKNNIPNEAYPIIALAGIAVAILHIMFAIRRGWPSGVFDWIKAFSFAPLMIYIGIMGRSASDTAYTIASAAVPLAVLMKLISHRSFV